ncbi:guanylate kinase [Acidisphaera rubrifaciens]|uniref:Guanylate kinase n=1 Tax=Acidisphaera rubrifaciens HS-AP3 TaxID=1231350 RepID=A0A0D6PCD6_9PROT|nr:guanylate kinase [Acidisphaera rubrifaciens]GAN78524.1 guanylate kinase [Acidisphaera rubrifaciens HS-AP3]
MIARRGICLVVAAPSGTGKSTITRRLLAADPALSLSVSVTTRAPRPGERDGVHYYFRDLPAFRAMAASGELLEHAEVFGRAYGTPRAPVVAALEAGRDVLFDIDWQGHRQLRDRLPGDVVGVFLLPPTFAALETRLHGRAADDAGEIGRRLQAARGEIAHWRDFDHVVVNDDLDRAQADVAAILRAARLERARQTGLAAFVDQLLAVRPDAP